MPNAEGCAAPGRTVRGLSGPSTMDGASWHHKEPSERRPGSRVTGAGVGFWSGRWSGPGRGAGGLAGGPAGPGPGERVCVSGRQTPTSPALGTPAA